MATIPTSDQWLKDTYSLTSPRSGFLKELDAAILAYQSNMSPTAKEAVKTAFDRWRFEQSKEGKDWRKSVRNQKGACTSLYRAVNDLDRRKLTAAELEAMQFISRQQALALQKQFEGKQLAFKGSTLMGMAQGAGTKWQQFKTGASSVGSAGLTGRGIVNNAMNLQKGANLLNQGGKAAAQGASQAATSSTMATIKQKVTEFCKQLCPDLDPNSVFQALHLGSVEQFATELAPFMGAISSGAKALIGWGGVAKTAWDKHGIEGKRFAIASGDPEAAFDAVLELLQRELISKSARAGVKTVAFTGKALGAFADFGAVTGPVVGLLEILADIFQTIAEYVRDYRECKAANESLRLGALNFDLFGTSPILGCYFLCVQDHSTIINFAVGDYGTPNFVFDAERLVGKIGPMLERARSFIQESRLEIPGMQGAKGIVTEKGTIETVKSKILERLEDWFLKPERPAKPDKSKIVGYGHQAGGGFGPGR